MPNTQQGPLVVLDAGCGTGQAIYDLRERWRSQQPDLNVTLLGIESDKKAVLNGPMSAEYAVPTPSLSLRVQRGSMPGAHALGFYLISLPRLFLIL